MAMTRSEIEKMIGPVDNQLAAEIVRTDASAADLAEALSWIHSDEARVNDGAHMPTGVVAELVELLEVSEEDDPAPAGRSATEGDWA